MWAVAVANSIAKLWPHEWHCMPVVAGRSMVLARRPVAKRSGCGKSHGRATVAMSLIAGRVTAARWLSSLSVDVAVELHPSGNHGQPIFPAPDRGELWRSCLPWLRLNVMPVASSSPERPWHESAGQPLQVFPTGNSTKEFAVPQLKRWEKRTREKDLRNKKSRGADRVV